MPDILSHVPKGEIKFRNGLFHFEFFKKEFSLTIEEAIELRKKLDWMITFGRWKQKCDADGFDTNEKIDF